MKFKLSTTLFIFIAAFAVGVFAQAGRTEVKTDGKKNQRAESTPTPTPVTKATPVVSAGNSTATTADDGEVIKVNTQLVSVPVRVMDKKGRFIGGLAKEDFKVFENGKEQEIALFSNENEPFTVALMLDMSYSTKFKINEIQSAALAFIDQLRLLDRVMVISFDGDVHVLCEATNDRKEIYRAIKSTAITTGTSLYEAIDLVINDRLRHIDGRKAIILFSDGVDTTSRRSNDLNNLHDAMELDSLIYTIRYDTFADVQSMKNGPIVQQPKISIPTQGGNPLPNILPTIMTPSAQGTTAAEYEKAVEYLDQLAIRTGGRRYDATSLGNLAEAYSRIASELREFYSVGYYPSEDRVAGKSSSVKVKVDREGVVVRARETYLNRKKPQIH
ncbi:MAG: VWA domain-containing protein [Pyrinomonadaceae bacterium]